MAKCDNDVSQDSKFSAAGGSSGDVPRITLLEGEQKKHDFERNEFAKFRIRTNRKNIEWEKIKFYDLDENFDVKIKEQDVHHNSDSGYHCDFNIPENAVPGPRLVEIKGRDSDDNIFFAKNWTLSSGQVVFFPNTTFNVV